jgi:hypothetical protein
VRLKTIGPSSSSSTTFGAKNHRYAPKETVRIHPWAVVMSGLIITPLQPVLLPSSIAGHPSDDQHYDSTSITTQNPADVVVSFNRNFAEFVGRLVYFASWRWPEILNRISLSRSGGSIGFLEIDY